MKAADIKEGETYMFVATDSPARKHLEGEPFKVIRIEAVFRRFKRKGTRKVKRFFNADNVGARAEELEPLPDREFPCQDDDCVGEYRQTGGGGPNGVVNYTCDRCGHKVSFP